MIKNKKYISLNVLMSTVVFLFCLISSIGTAIAITLGLEPKEEDTKQEVGLAAVWIMSQVTQGGYLKPSVNVSFFDNDVSLLWELEAGWRFTRWIKLGASLKRTMTEVDSVNNHVTAFGLVAGTSARNRTLGEFTLDLNIGSIDTGDIKNARYYIEPGLQLKRHLYKTVFWTSGIYYRYVEAEPLALLGKDSFNSISFKLGIVGGKY